MKYTTILLLLVSQNVNPQTGKEILLNCAEKIKGLNSISYTINSDNGHEKVSADISLKRDKLSPVFESARFRVQGIAMSDEGSKQIAFAYNGGVFSFWDQKTLEFARMDSPSYSKLARTGLMAYFMLVPPPYWQEKPFGVVLDRLKDVAICGDTIILGKACHIIRTRIESNSPLVGTELHDATWYIGKSDSLLLGHHSRTEKYFIKVQSLNKEIEQIYFLLAHKDPKKITGLEPLNEGLLAVGTKAPGWTLPSSRGMISLDSLKGRVVLLDFWGTWCVPCIRALPHIQAIYARFKDQPVEVLGISVEMEKGRDPVGFLRSRGCKYPVALEGHTITERYKVQIFPSVYLIDKNGMIIHAEYGSSRQDFEEDLVKRIQAALQN